MIELGKRDCEALQIVFYFTEVTQCKDGGFTGPDQLGSVQCSLLSNFTSYIILTCEVDPKSQHCEALQLMIQADQVDTLQRSWFDKP